MYLVDTLFISHPSSAHMSLFLVELLCDLSLLLLLTNESARNRVMLSLLYSFLFSLKLIDLYFVCLVFCVLIDRSLFHSNFQRTGKSILGVFKAPQYFVSFIGPAVIWGLTSLYHSSRNFLPLFVVSPSYILLF